jgi:hypothetical protein
MNVWGKWSTKNLTDDEDSGETRDGPPVKKMAGKGRNKGAIIFRRNGRNEPILPQDCLSINPMTQCAKKDVEEKQDIIRAFFMANYGAIMVACVIYRLI